MLLKNIVCGLNKILFLELFLINLIEKTNVAAPNEALRYFLIAAKKRFKILCCVAIPGFKILWSK